MQDRALGDVPKPSKHKSKDLLFMIFLILVLINDVIVCDFFLVVNRF